MLQVQHIYCTSVQVTIVEDPYNFYTDTDSDPDPGYLKKVYGYVSGSIQKRNQYQEILTNLIFFKRSFPIQHVFILLNYHFSINNHAN